MIVTESLKAKFSLQKQFIPSLNEHLRESRSLIARHWGKREWGVTANEDRVIFQVIVLELEVVVTKHCEMY